MTDAEIICALLKSTPLTVRNACVGLKVVVSSSRYDPILILGQEGEVTRFDYRACVVKMEGGKEEVFAWHSEMQKIFVVAENSEAP